MKIFNQTLETLSRKTAASVRRLDRERLRSHLAVSRYGSFQLTDAIRPSFELDVVPEEGFRRDFYVEPGARLSVPVVLASVSSEKLFDVFFALLDELGDVVDVVVESSHCKNGPRVQFNREGIDLPVLKSVLCDYEDLALNDGCFGLAAMNSSRPFEIQFDEHKILTAYGDDLRGVEKTLKSFGIEQKPDLRLLTEAEHIHSSRTSFCRLFDALKFDLGAE